MSPKPKYPETVKNILLRYKKLMVTVLTCEYILAWPFASKRALYQARPAKCRRVIKDQDTRWAKTRV
jgi:hypothetical protein